MSKNKSCDIEMFLFISFTNVSLMMYVCVKHGRVWGPKLYIFVTQLYKPMSLVAQPLLHPSMVYASFTNLLQWTKHKCTKIIRNQKPKFLHNKLCIHTIILSQVKVSIPRSHYPLIYYIKGNYSRNYLSLKIITR